jgi:hypothetical protein
VSLFSQLLGIVAVFMFIACILFVFFGQLTVRKLRNNPKTKDSLGLEYVSGWDIVNVAQSFAFPRSWSRKMENSPLSFMHANSGLLFKHTNKFDQILGAVFYWLLMSSAFSCILLILLNYIGIFPD